MDDHGIGRCHFRCIEFRVATIFYLIRPEEKRFIDQCIEDMMDHKGRRRFAIRPCDANTKKVFRWIAVDLDSKLCFPFLVGVVEP